MTSEAYKRKAISLMNYLKELIDLNLTHITDYRDYPNYLLFSEIPQEEGCFTQAWGYSEETPEIWLEIKKPKEPPFPPIPKSCEKWVREETLNQSDEEPILKDSITNVYQEKGIDGEFLTKTEVKYLRDFPEVLELWKKYIENNWRPWQEKHQKWKRIYKVYKKLFEIYIELGQLGEQYELVVGMGLLRWRLPDGRSVERHLLALKASLDFDEKTGTFVLHADEQDTKVYLELEALDVYQPLMPQNFENIVKELEENPWEQILIRNVLTSIANVLGKEGRGIYTEQLSIPEGPVPSNPEVLFAPALILRKRKLLAIYEHLEQIKKHIENNKEIPENLQKLIGLQESQIKSKSGASKKPSEIADNRLYFPLPSNEQQRSIAEKIKDSQGILVQGPPGTGKSQTIANLICHLLAYGQRILITAKAPRALEVLHGLLPEKIKDLCVSLLGHGQEEVQSLKNSVSQIQQKESGWNNEESQKQIRKLEGELNELLQSKAKKENRLKLAREKDTRVFTLCGGYSGTLAEIIQKVNKEKTLYDWFLDEPCDSLPIANLQRKISEWLAKRNSMAPELVEEIGYQLIQEEKLIAPSEFEKIKFQEAKLIEELGKIHIQRTPENTPLFLTSSENVNELYKYMDAYSHAFEDVQRRPYSWIPTAVKEILSDLDTPWRELYKHTQQYLDEVQRRKVSLQPQKFVYPREVSEENLLIDLKSFLNYLEEGGTKKWWIFKPREIRRLRYLRKVTYGGRPCIEEEALTDAIEYLELKQRIHYLWEIWKGKSEPVEGIPAVQIGYLAELQEALAACLDLYEKRRQVKDVLSRIREYIFSSWLDKEAINSVLSVCRFILYQKSLKTLQERVLSCLRELELCIQDNACHPLHQELKECLKERNADRYCAVYARLQSIRKQKEEYEALNQQAAELGRYLPCLISAIQQDLNNPNWKERIDALENAYDWKKAKMWIDTYLAEDDIFSLQEDIRELDEKIAKTLGSLAAEKAWAACLSRMTEEQSKALRLFSRVRIPRTGKTVLRKRREAQQYLNDCKDAVPAWIMPLHRVYESVKPQSEPFDVVIVDEASQCGPEGIPLFFLGKKIVIVGDDKQISPTADFIPDESVQILKKRYLSEFQYPERFEPRNSLYDHAYILFSLQNQIRLREHFRCMPEIISFSNKHFYSDNPLIPLKQYTADRLEPLKRVYVENGYREGFGSRVINRPEAERVVEEIKRCCQDKRYEGKTMGVIILQGHAQDRLIESMLLEHIGIEEMNRRKLTCGDPYSFQGGERDVIFLSMVAAPNERIGAYVGEDDERRFNVAASRAREQMWLFHSVDISDLGQNCLRRKLLLHFLEPQEERSHVSDLNDEELVRKVRISPRTRENVPAPFESWFEVDVYLDLVSQGLCVYPQYEIAKRRIDLLVEGKNGVQLAVECYGDRWHGPEQYEQDMIRQKQLERCGLKFFIIRECEYYSNRGKIRERLLRKVDSLGIRVPQSDGKSKKKPSLPLITKEGEYVSEREYGGDKSKNDSQISQTNFQAPHSGGAELLRKN